ncbi:MAG: hypothetical protein JWO45_1618 [Spartobacteria bacterium]|nr:hypothetical protein [Spartobacteria bacterium]
MSLVETTRASIRAVKDAVRNPPTLDDIGDGQFMTDLGKLKQLRSFLIEQAVQLKPTETSSISFGKLNLLRYREDGRSPTEDEWDALERLNQTLFGHLSDPLRRRFLYSRIPAWFAPFVLALLFVAMGSLISSAANYEHRTGVVLLSYMAWLGSLGAIGAVAYIGMNALSVQDDATFDLSNTRLIWLRIVLGSLFGIVLGLPVGYQTYMKFLLLLLDAKTAEVDGNSIALLLMPFVLGFSTSLVIMVLNQFIEAIQAFFGKKTIAPPSPVAPVPVPVSAVQPVGP